MSGSKYPSSEYPDTPWPGQPLGLGSAEPPHQYTTPFSNHFTLSNGLVRYWKLDETSGNRADSVGSNTLTDNNTVTSVGSGPAGVVGQFTAANSEYLSSNPGIGAMTGDFTIVGWINFDNRSSYNTNTGAGWFISLPGVDADGSVICAVRASGIATVRYAEGGSINGGRVTAHSFDGWHFLAIRRTSGTITIWVDGVSESTNAIGAESGWGTHHTMIGRSYPGAGYYFNDKIARIGVWSSTSVADSVITSLYNSGSGKSYSSLTTAEKVGLTSYWNLDEASGNRADSHGSTTLTDNATVTSVINAGGAMRNTAASFVAANSESLSSTVQFDGTASWSVAGWVYQSGNQGSYAGIVESDNGATGFGAYANGGGGQGSIDFYFRGAPSAKILTNAASLNAWHFIYLQLDGSTGKVGYSVDGSALSESVALTYSPRSTFALAKVGGSATYFNGLMDEFGVWSRVLTAQERTDLYAAGAGLFY